MAGMGAHHSPRAKTDEWLTPPNILRALGEFDLDPCSPIKRPWPTAKRHLTIVDNGLISAWSGRVWLNPPYGQVIGKWMGRMAAHNHGIALIFARTETDAFFEHVWNAATAVLFLRGRISFCYVDGRQAKKNSGAPSMLCAYGAVDALILERSGLVGQYIRLR